MASIYISYFRYLSRIKYITRPIFMSRSIIFDRYDSPANMIDSVLKGLKSQNTKIV